MKTKFLILGAGPAGLGAGYRLKELGERDFLIAERNEWVGGLATSFVDNAGFTWDIGGHVQFSHYKYFDQVMDSALGREGWLEHERESWVWMKDRFIPYPFQNNIRYLPKNDLWRCLQGVLEASRAGVVTPNNFKEWSTATFGSGITEIFMLPYNFKVWAYPLETMAYQWIGERVAVVDLARILENVTLEKDDVSWGPNNRFRFPKFGGTGAIWKSVAESIGSASILLKNGVVSLRAADKEAILSDGTKVSYEYLLSTAPVDSLCSMVEEVSPKLRERAQGLKYSSTHVVGIGLEGTPSPELSTKCWMYFPESNSPFYRVTLFSKYSPHNVPNIATQFSLMTETSESSSKPVNRKTLVAETLAGLRNTKLINDSHKVVSTWHHSVEYGYPTPSLERDAILRDVVPELEKLRIYSRGRFGGWKYEVSNQDHTFMQGVEWAERLVSDKPETTYRV